jgi:hypothetical protein
MKNLKALSPLFLSVSLILLAGCSSSPFSSSKSNGQDIASIGPTVLDVRTSPGIFALNQNLAPVSTATVVADVKDFNAKVDDVHLRFLHVPLEITMQQVTPSTWQADLTQEQLKQLAVNGHTMKYEANVIAKDDKGLTAVSAKSVEIAIKAPDVMSSG